MSSLPKIVHPRFELTVPSTKQKVKFRPFTVREEKLLLMTREAKDADMIVDTYKQIIANCVEAESFDVNQLATFDIEYFFLKLRAKSVSNISTIIITDPEDEQEYTVDINLDEVEVVYSESHKTTFMLTDTLGLRMKYPTFDAIRAYEVAAAAIDDEELAARAGSFATIRACMDCLFEGDAVYTIADYSTSDVDDLISDMTNEQLKQIKLFMDTMPRMAHTVTYKRNDGTEGSITLEGLQSFF